MSAVRRAARAVVRLAAAVGRAEMRVIDAVGAGIARLQRTPPGRFLRWLVTRKLFWYGVVVLTVFLAYHEFSDRVTERQDAALLGAMSFVLFECLVGTFLSTEHWRLRIMGLISALAGMSILYFTVFDSVYRWVPSISRRPEAVELARSFFLIATVALGVAYNRYLWKNRKNPPAWWHKDERHPGRRWYQDFFD